MTNTYSSEENLMTATVVGRISPDQLWPVSTQWRAVVPVRGEFESPEWVLERVKPVPLSSRTERSLLEAVQSDNGRAVLDQASEPGEHRVSAAVIAALRLAASHPDRALRFLAWLKDSPTDPRSLRFLRRYLPQIQVLVQLEPDIATVMPLSRLSLGLLAAELLRETGQTDLAATLLDGLSPCAPVALSRASLRVAVGELDEASALAADRPIVDDVSAALRVVHARALDLGDNPERALAELAPVLAFSGLARPVERSALEIRGRALRRTGRDVEASLVESDLGIQEASTSPKADPTETSSPQPPLFGRSVADALDDAWARVRRQPRRTGDEERPYDPVDVAHRSEDALALIGQGNLEVAEAQLLADLDCADDWVDSGGPVVDELYIMLAGVFDQQQLSAEEVATLERLRDAHRRAGSTLPSEVEERLIEVRATLDALS